MKNWFYPHIPPSWLANPYAKGAAGTTFKYISEVIPLDWITDHPDKVLWHDPRIEYSINSHGYREKEYEESYKKYEHFILGFGHSTIAGNAVADEDTVLRRIENSLPNTRVLNFGVAGGSSDTVARLISCTVPYFKTISLKLSVCVLWPQDVRREIMLDNYKASWQPTMDPPIKEYPMLIDDTSNSYNLEKNKCLVENVCDFNETNLYTIPYSLYQKALDSPRARNGIDPSAESHKMFSDYLLSQLTQET
jgi:hypothetical protein